MRKIDNYQLNSARTTLHLLALGEFGLAVGKLLQELVPWTVVIASSFEELVDMPEVQTSCALALVSWRPASHLCHLLNKMSYTYQINFIPAVLSSPYLELGPVVIPQKSACYACYERRFLQHTEFPQLYKQLYTYYDTHPLAGPAGYLPPFIYLAATRLAQLVEQSLESPEQVAGYHWRWNLINAEVLQGTVVGVHGCPFCGLRCDEQRRSHQAMREYLCQVFTWDAAHGASASGHVQDSEDRQLLIASPERKGEH